MRKSFLLPLAALALAGPAFACDMLEYTRVQVSPHVHAFVAAEGTTGIVNGNIAAVIGRDAVLVVDAGQFLGNARRIVEDIRKLTRAPIGYLVNTHWHGDHMLANSVFREASPSMKILAHPFTIAEGAKRYGDDYAGKTSKQLPILADQAKKRAEASTNPDEKLWVEKTVACAEKILPEVAVTRYVPPEVAVDREMRIDLGGVVAVVKHIGTGNTPGDLIVWVEGDRVVATGDMVVAPVPYAIGSAGLEAWAATLGEVRKLGAAAIVPGHGPVMKDDAYLRDVEALLATTRAQLARMVAGGVAKSEAAAKLDVADFRTRHVTTPMRRQAFERFFVGAAIQEAWPKPPQ